MELLLGYQNGDGAVLGLEYAVVAEFSECGVDGGALPIQLSGAALDKLARGYRGVDPDNVGEFLVNRAEL